MRTDRWDLATGAFEGFILSSNAKKARPLTKIFSLALPVLRFYCECCEIHCFTRCPADNEHPFPFSSNQFFDYLAGQVGENDEYY